MKVKDLIEMKNDAEFLKGLSSDLDRIPRTDRDSISEYDISRLRRIADQMLEHVENMLEHNIQD